MVCFKSALNLQIYALFYAGPACLEFALNIRCFWNNAIIATSSLEKR